MDQTNLHAPRSSRETDALPARTRLRQAHDQWHRALDDYPYADRFFLDINALIPALRAVTFVLQKNLRHHGDFDAWYGVWQDRMKADAVLRWVVEARNHIEKVGDLELNSTARVSIIASWLDAPYLDLDVPPLLDPHQLARTIVEREKFPDRMRKEGLLKVERRWVAPDLPDHELLEACVYAWGYLDGLLRDAEAVFLGAPAEPQPVAVGWPDCMSAGPDARTALLNLATEEFIHHASVPHEPSDEDLAHYEREIGEASRSIPRPDDTLRGQVVWYHSLGRLVLQRDGYHHLIAFLRRNGEFVQAVEMMPEDQQDKYVLMEKVARLVRSTGADEVIVNGEMWVAPPVHPDDSRFDLRAGERDDKTEALTTYGVNSNGEIHAVSSAFTHEGSKIILLEPEVGAPLAVLSMSPVLKVWGIDPLPPGATIHRGPRGDMWTLDRDA